MCLQMEDREQCLLPKIRGETFVSRGQLNTWSLYPVFRVHLINTTRTSLTEDREWKENGK